MSAPPRDERRALLFLFVLLAAGAGVRLAGQSGSPPGAALSPSRPSPEQAAELAAQAARARRAAELARPLAPGERVDLDRAGAEELARLPRIGREMARRIVAEREARGPFGSLSALRRVSGIGPATLAALERYASFSAGGPGLRPEGTARASGAGEGRVLGPAMRSVRPAGPGLAAGVGRAEAGASGGATPRARRRDSECATLRTPLALNSASARELECLRGVGPVLAARIVADRTARGPFREVSDLDRVPGIGPALLRRLGPLLRVR